MGKLLGVILGYLLFHIPGAIIGFIIGVFFDGARKRVHANSAVVNEYFFKALFCCMGHLAKSDGAVSQSEIQVATSIMQQMQFSDSKRREAIEHFTRGKIYGFDMAACLQELRANCEHKSLLRMFMQFQFQAAFADGEPNNIEQNVLSEMADELGFSPREFNQLYAMFRAQWIFAQRRHSGRSYQQHSFDSARHSNNDDLKEAYATLGVSEGTDIVEVKKAYRKLMNQYHPDKLVAKGLPEEMMKAATAKTQSIKEAYELIKRQK
jgi:DnaJ like chaperone protein